MKLSRTKWTIILSLAIVAAVFIFKARQSEITQTAGEYLKIKGSPKADFKVVDFFDFQCPSCAASAEFISEYMKKYPGRIQVEAKYYPLSGHRHSMTAAKYAECARKQGKFWEMHDKLFVNQPEWRDKESVDDDFNMFAASINLASEPFADCMADPTTEQVILQDKEEGKGYRIRSTPSFFVNGKFIAGRKAFESTVREFFGEPDESQETESGA